MKRTLARIDRAVGLLTDYVSNLLLLIIVLVVLYNVVMRYVFDSPPFWTDRISVFANIGMVLFGLSLTIRGRDLIAMQALYEKVSPRLALALNATWNAIILIFSVIFAWYGLEAAVNMPGQYWDFLVFCIDLGQQEASKGNIVFLLLKSVEDVVAMMIRPFCVEGAVPQRYLAMLMPISGVLFVIASAAVLAEDARKFNALGKGEAVPSDEATE